MVQITDVPVEIFLEALLPILPIQDLLCLTMVNKFFAVLCSDNTLWARRLQNDFNFSGAGTARTSGWKFVYQRLSKPRVYVWGEKSQGRLGLTKFPHSVIPAVPFPTQLHIPGARIVNLIAAGMSFHALDSLGNVYVWGTLDGTNYTLNSDGFSETGKTSPTPLRLQLPAPVRAISCGRLHSSTLDSRNQIWLLLSWGRAWRLSTSYLASPESTPIQIECGWTYTAALTKAGQVVIWWPYNEPLRTLIADKNADLDAAGDNKAHAQDGVIPCVVSDIIADPFVLPPLPRLPKLSNSIDDDMPQPDATTTETRVIQIGGFDGQVVALTNQGHVLTFSPLHDETAAKLGTWQYLPHFSELEHVQEAPVFTSGKLEPPASFKVTHVSAHFETFTAYSTGSNSIVLMGGISTTVDTRPKIIPELQYKSVISVVLGDYHYGALTSTGKLLTWGAYSQGALGLGDPVTIAAGSPGGFLDEEARLHALSRRRGTPREVNVPTEVRFDHGRKKPKDRFCILAAASGWHMGALCIDLEANEVDDESEYESDEEEAPNSQPIRQHIFRGGRGGGIGQTPPIVNPYTLAGAGGHDPPFQQEPGDAMIGGGLGIYRIGFAGRGAGRGAAQRGRGRGIDGPSMD